MAKFVSNYIKVAECEYKTIGKKNIPLFELKLVEDDRKKNDQGEWEVTGKNFFDGKIWGDKATEASLELTEGTILDLSPVEQSGNNGTWLKYPAEILEESWDYQGKSYSKHVVKIWDYKIRTFNND